MIRGVGSDHRGPHMQIKFMFAPVIASSLSHKSYRPPGRPSRRCSSSGLQGNVCRVICDNNNNKKSSIGSSKQSCLFRSHNKQQ